MTKKSLFHITTLCKANSKFYLISFYLLLLKTSVYNGYHNHTISASWVTITGDSSHQFAKLRVNAISEVVKNAS